VLIVTSSLKHHHHHQHYPQHNLHSYLIEASSSAAAADGPGLSLAADPMAAADRAVVSRPLAQVDKSDRSWGGTNNDSSLVCTGLKVGTASSQL